MLTDVTVNVRLPIADMSPAPDGLEALDDEADGEDDELDAPLPPKWPITVTWWPTCSAKLTLESAINFSSLPPPDERLVVDVLVDVGLPACALSLLGLLDVVALLDSLPNLKFFNTKLSPPLALLELALLDGLALDVSAPGDPPARCRQPVALAPLALALVDACGVDVVGLCAASVPHSATAVLSVTAHGRWCVFFMTSPRRTRLQGTIHGLFLADTHAGPPAREGSGPGGRRWQPQ